MEFCLSYHTFADLDSLFCTLKVLRISMACGRMKVTISQEVSALDNLKQVLIDHARRYPLMQPTDAVKLIYQNEFGGGHLIRSEAACIAYLQREYESVIQSADVSLTESIGNGMVRATLKALDAHNYTPEMLAQDFIRSSSTHTGSLESFLKKLEILHLTTQEGHFGFSPKELEDYLLGYAKAGYPMVSHSDTYRRAYGPAYRIVPEKCLHSRKNV